MSLGVNFSELFIHSVLIHVIKIPTKYVLVLEVIYKKNGRLIACREM